MREQIQKAESACAEKRRELAAQMAAFQLPEGEIAQVGVVIAGYQKVREAMNPPVQEARTLRDQIAPDSSRPGASRRRRPTRPGPGEGQPRIRELLQQQTEAGHRVTKGARLKQQIETLQRQVAELEQDLGANPEDYHPEADYPELYRARVAGHVVEVFEEAGASSCTSMRGLSRRATSICFARSVTAGVSTAG